MIDRRVTQRLDERAVRYCVIGATALAAHGWARFTADVDLLVMDDSVLDQRFWSGVGSPQIHRGDHDDPLAGIVRFSGEVAHDVIVGRGAAMQLAVATAQPSSVLGCPVATPLALVLLKLEAGGPQDRHDIIGLVQSQRAINGAPWLDLVQEKMTLLSESARDCWAKISSELRSPGR